MDPAGRRGNALDAGWRASGRWERDWAAEKRKGGLGRTRGSGPRKVGVGPGEEKGKRAKRERWAGAAGLEAGFLGLFWFSFLFFKQTQTTLKSN